MKITNLLKNRTILGISCIALSAVICFVVSPLLSRTSEKTVTVVRAAAEIKSGDEITKTMVTEVKMSDVNQPDNTLSDSKAVIGKYASMDMTKGDYVLANKIADTPFVENTYLTALDGNSRAISITLKSFATGLSGKLKSGDIVSVVAPDYQKTGLTVIPTELQYIEVIAATGKSGADVEVTGEAEAELPSTVTLLADERQSMLLAELEKEGTIHLALVYRGDRKTAEKFLQAQKEINQPPEETPDEAQNDTGQEGGDTHGG